MGISSVKGSTYPTSTEPVRVAKREQNPPEPSPDKKAEQAAATPKPPEVINLQGQATGRLLNTTA